VQRAGHRIRGQHRRLHALLRDAERAAQEDAPLRKRLALLHDGLHAHFDLEEAVYFPALHGLERAARRALVRLARDHDAFLEELAELLEDPPDAAMRLLLLGRALREHEQQEEELFGGLLDDPAA
jgi:iron-sulfur cluster repair protein YtfE (RIC family)